jgi:hypothetical protein
LGEANSKSASATIRLLAKHALIDLDGPTKEPLGQVVLALVLELEPGRLLYNGGDNPRHTMLARYFVQEYQCFPDQLKLPKPTYHSHIAQRSTRGPFLRAMMRKASCLISCSHIVPEGGVPALGGRAGRAE